MSTKWIIIAAIAFLLLTSSQPETLAPGAVPSRLRGLGLGFDLATTPLQPPPVSVPFSPLPTPPPAVETLRDIRLRRGFW
jgi:hypothetical protein